MLDINAVERVLDKRYRNGAADNNLIAWLEHLKVTSWKNAPKIIDGFIDAIQQTPSKVFLKREHSTHPYLVDEDRKIMYSTKKNRCSCHPETCGCDPWAIFRDGEKFISVFEKEKAKLITKALNAYNPTLKRNMPDDETRGACSGDEHVRLA